MVHVRPSRSSTAASPSAGRAGVLALVILAATAVAAVPVLPSALAAQDASVGEAWRIVNMKQSSLVLARDGSLIGEIGSARRVLVTLQSLPPYLHQAFVAVEDQRFYQHDGVDLVGLAGALKDAVRGDVRGGSTITQQLVGNMHPDIIDRSDRSIGRKLREQQAAREMEKRYSKPRILEAYLNFIDFGHGWRGVEMASRHYFGKGAAELSLAEAATLAALPKSPPLYDPIRNRERARARRDLVLELMAQQGYITRARATAAQRQPLHTAANAGYSVRAPYFVDAVSGIARRGGVPVADGGYVLHTTLDPLLQRSAESALDEGLTAAESRPGYRHLKYAGRPDGRTDYLQGAVVVVDPGTGHVRALVGGRDYGDSQYDRAVNALRQPGSAFKPFVYATAIADSLPANAIVADTALAIPMANGTIYRPTNSDDAYLGELTLREALARSRNTVAVQIALRYGMERIAAMAHAMGVDTPIAPYPSSAIGASVVHPLDLVGSYVTLATLGVRVEPRLLLRVEDARGRTVWTTPGANAESVLDPKVAFIVRDMMRDVVDRGTATSVRRIVPARVPVAGKTGTTNDNTDVWFVGITPELVAGSWMGFDRPKTITSGAAGGSLAAPVVARIFADHYARRGSAAWQPPEGLIQAELDRLSGQLADAFTPPDRRYTEYFIPGTEPAALRVGPWRMFEYGGIVVP
ncbi:MAG: transglycosylase domain-containing protein [Gemmatimonadaceae bacterium]